MGYGGGSATRLWPAVARNDRVCGGMVVGKVPRIVRICTDMLADDRQESAGEAGGMGVDGSFAIIYGAKIQ